MFVVDVTLYAASAPGRSPVASTEQVGGRLPRVASSHRYHLAFQPTDVADPRERYGGRYYAVDLRRNDSVLEVRPRQEPNLDYRMRSFAPSADVFGRLLYSPSGQLKKTYEPREMPRRCAF